MAPVTVSAPGKMLLAGGYLVLERPNVGLVVAADRRFYTTVDTGTTPGKIVVQSPQFHASWTYVFDAGHGKIHPSLENPSTNPFVEKTLRVCLLHLLDKGTESSSPNIDPVSLDVTIRADNDFYSIMPHLKEDRSLEAVSALPKFLKCPTDDEGKAIINKTGLGSSAALTTSLVGALVQYFTGSADITKIHNLAQICHCHAQGKVGSGFDVSSACYGTHIYKRFPKCLLPDLLSQLEYEEEHENDKNGDQTTTASTANTALANLAEDIWDDDMVTPLTLPNLQVLLADVCGGSESPSMARTILAWKKEYGVASSQKIPHWHDLQDLNQKVVDIIQETKKDEATIEYDALATLPSSEWPASSPLAQLAACFKEIRHHLKSMGDQAKVPIEPDEQTKLCDATSALPGVVACLVPGAGGYDAVACLCIDRPSVHQAIGNLWASWESPVICPLNVKVSDKGLRVEADMSFLA